jgi:hypothetical protein
MSARLRGFSLALRGEPAGKPVQLTLSARLAAKEDGLPTVASPTIRILDCHR